MDKVTEDSEELPVDRALRWLHACLLAEHRVRVILVIRGKVIVLILVATDSVCGPLPARLQASRRHLEFGISIVGLVYVVCLCCRSECPQDHLRAAMLSILERARKSMILRAMPVTTREESRVLLMQLSQASPHGSSEDSGAPKCASSCVWRQVLRHREGFRSCYMCDCGVILFVGINISKE